MDVRDLSWDEFRDAVGAVYAVEAPDGALALRLEAATPLADSGRVGGAFRLELLGPVDPALPQAIYPFSGEGVEPFEMFIVPIARDAAGTRYEAIFY
jgi:hypothetical protein